jgi:1,4-dihydroxy-2-naphthoate octaprenyltransferase
VRSALVHLRLPFQLLLAPIFLWGWLLSGGGWSAGVGLAFVAFHVFLYGGATAFNSAYDRDVGPVGGLASPPPVGRGLVPFSLSVKAIGWLLAWLVNPVVFGVYGGFVLLSVAYSHPRWRLKARPIASLLVVAVGQGVLAFVAAWAASRGQLSSAWSRDGLLGATAAVLVVVGLYPLTQVFQVDEDRARGDRTLAVVFGPGASFRLALGCLTVGGVLLVLVVVLRYGALDGLLLAAGLGLELGAVGAWARRFDPLAVMANYGRAMRLNATCAAALSAYLVYRLLVAA